MIKSELAIVALLIFAAGCKSTQETHQIGSFHPQSDRFWEVIPREAMVENIGIAFEFTEGPVWHPGGYLIFSDIPANIIYRWTGKKYVVFRQPSNNSNGLLVATDGSVLACEHGSRSLTRFSPDGELTTIADR